MANRQIDYVSKDFDSIVDALITYATVNFGADTNGNRQWTDFNADDFSRTWLELVAYVGDLIFYYLDVQATQSTLETATIRSVVLNIAKQFGFIVPTATSSSGLVTFDLKIADVIPFGFRLVANNGAPFFVASSVPAPGSTTLAPIIQVIQGEQKTDTFIAKGVQNEELILNFTSLVKDLDNAIAALISPIVLVNSVPFTLVETFINSLPTDTHFKLFTDPDGRSILRFGDGIFAKQLVANDSVVVNYRIGGGTVGNIGAHTLTTLLDSDGNIISVTNDAAFSGGSDELTTDKLKELIPANLKTLDRAVTLQDYADIILADFPGISKAEAERNTKNPGIDINIYVVPTGPEITPISTNLTLLNSLSDFIDKRKTVTTVVSIKDAFGVSVVFKIEMFLQSGISKSSVLQNVQTTLENFFNLETGDTDGTGTKFGQTILLNNLYAILDTVEGIDRFEIKKFHYKPRVEITKALGSNYLLGEVKLFPNADQSQWLVAPEYSATNPSYIPYTVYKKYQGKITNLNTNSIADQELNFASIESTTSAINVNGSSNIVFDSTKTFLLDQFVGGTSPVTLTFVSGNTWTLSGMTFTPRQGDRVKQGSNFSFIKQVIDPTTFLLSPGLPSVLTTGAASLIRDKYLFVDAANNIWNIDFNDAHSLTLSQFAINNIIISDVTAGDYKIVNSFIGANLIFKGLVFSGIDYNTHNTFYRENSNFDLVGTIGDDFFISKAQLQQGNFGVPTTIDAFTPSTPNPGSGRVHFADSPDLSGVTVGPNSSFVLIDSNENVFELLAVDNNAKTVDILHQSGVTVNPLVGGGSPASVCGLYYSDNSEISFVIGIANVIAGLGFAATGLITTIIAANISDAETFTLNDGVNPAVIFEFDKNASVTAGHIAVDISAATTANDVRDAIISAVNGAPTLAISASTGGTAAVLLQNDSIGTAGNQTITETVADAGFIVQGMLGGLNTGSEPTPVIPDVADISSDIGTDSGGNILDHFEFNISSYLDDVVNLRKNEIPQFDANDLELDLRGGVV